MTQKMREYKRNSEELLYSCTCKDNSKMCKEVRKLIGRKDISKLQEIIENEDFDPNERFDSAYVAGENFINYAINNSCYEAAKIMLNKRTIKLSKDDKERMLLQLISQRKFKLLYHLIETIENKKINIVRYILGVAKQDYETIVEPTKRLKSNA